MFTEFGPRESHWYAYPSARSTPRERCLSFWYYMVGQCGELKVYVFIEGEEILTHYSFSYPEFISVFCPETTKKKNCVVTRLVNYFLRCGHQIHN